MPLWGEVELLCRAVTEEGRNEAERILSQARAEAERIIAEARERTDKEYEGEILLRRSAAYAEAKQIVDSAELEARKHIMTFREEVVREILDALKERLKRFREESSYAEFLMSALREGIESLSGGRFLVELNGEDLRLLEDKARKWAEELSITIEFVPSGSLDGGVRVCTGDRLLLYDNSLSARLKRSEDDIRQEIWRRIFEAERKTA